MQGGAPSRQRHARARLEDGGHPPPACEDARHYEVEFRKTGGHDRLKVKSMTILVDGRETAQFVQRPKDAGKSCVTITGLGMPLKLRVVVLAAGGADSLGHAIICQRAKYVRPISWCR